MREAFWMLQILLILFAPPVVFVLLPKNKGHRREALGGAALIVVGMFALFFGAFLVGETLSDPGGWAALSLIALWLVPTLVMSLVAWWRPAWAVIVLGMAIAGLSVLYIWSAIAPEQWSAFEDATGPVRAVIAFAISVPTAVLGRRRPFAAGLMLVMLALLPAALFALSSAGTAGVSPMVVVTVPAGIAGVLFLLSDIHPSDSPGSGIFETPVHPSSGIGAGRP